MKVITHSTIPLSEQEPLWRYMRLSTFFALVDGFAFLPSVETLRGADPAEGEIGCDAAWIVAQLGDMQPWLTNHGSEWEKQQLNDSALFAWTRTQLIVDIWTRELRKRRAVWCWHASQHESAAMWAIYGNAGVAIRSNIGLLGKALPSIFEFAASRMHYVDRNVPQAPFNPEGSDGAKLLKRPFLLKSREFQHEQEVRLWTRCSPFEEGLELSGVDGAQLIEEIRWSPMIQHREAESLTKTVKARLPQCPHIERSQTLGHRRAEQRSRAGFRDAMASRAPRAVLDDSPDLPTEFREL